MTVIRIALALLLWASAVGPARAGAWTVPEGRTHIISDTTYSTASSYFDNHASVAGPTYFEKLLNTQNIEYGWRDGWTLFLTPEFVTAKFSLPTGVVLKSKDFALAGGARMRLLDGDDVVSLQASMKAGGAFDMSVASAPGDSGSQYELRLLYGRGFDLFHRHGFIDIELAGRKVTGPRPDESVLDVTLGLNLMPKMQVMLQSFNTVAAGNASPPFGYYRIHKVQLSTVSRIARRWSLQSAFFYSPTGQNSLVEQGVSLALWTAF